MYKIAATTAATVSMAFLALTIGGFYLLYQLDELRAVVSAQSVTIRHLEKSIDRLEAQRK